MSLLVVGSVALDTIKTPHACWDEALGGSASYFATVASLIAPVRIVAVVGQDFPDEHLDFLRTRGIDLDGLERVPGRTFRWSGRYAENMVDRETLDTQLNVFESFRPRIPERYRDSHYVFLANIDPNLQLDVLNQVDHPRLVACDTMNFWLTERHLPALRRVLERTDVVFLNDEEARLLSGEHNLVKAAAAVRLLGVGRVIIKRGDAGALLFDDAGPFWAPAFPLAHIADPTGAGDCFAGGFMAYLCHTEDLSEQNIRRAMVFGSVTASFAVEAASIDRLRTLTRPELLLRCAEFGRLVRFEELALRDTASV